MKRTIESLARLTSLVRKGTLTVAVATLALGLTNTPGAGAIGEAVYCRVSFKGSKQNIRAVLEVIDGRSNTKVALPAE